MSTKYNNFESKTVLDQKKDENRKARQLILEQAKRKYEKEEAKKEKARKLGEGTWMLDSVSQRIAKEEKSLEHRSKKKHKKEKKKKKKKRKRSSSSSSDGSDEDEQKEWVEAKADGEKKETEGLTIKGPQLQRESWMEAPLDLLPLTSRQEIREARDREKRAAREEEDKLSQPGQHARELNPYWKNGGTGLPEEEEVARSKTVAAASSQTLRAGDGGLSWLRTAYKRYKQQAEDEGRSLEDVVAERWGSLSKLEDMLQEAERNSRRQGQRFPHLSSSRRSGPGDGSRRRSRSRSPAREYRRRSRERSRDRSRERRRDEMERRDRREGRDEDRKSKRSFQKPTHSDEEDSDERSSKYRRRSRDRSRERHSETDRRDRNSGRGDGHEERGSKRSFQKPNSDEDSDVKTSKYRGDSRSSESRPRGFMKPGGDNLSRSPVRESDRFRSRGSESDVRAGGAVRWRKKQLSPEVTAPAQESREKSRGGGKHAGSGRDKKKQSDSSSSDSSSDSEASDDDAAQTEVAAPLPPKILSEQELNDLAAKILRAEIMGDDALKAELESKLAAAREAREAAKAGDSSLPDFSCRKQSQAAERAPGRGQRETTEEDNVVVLSRTGKGDMLRPVVREGEDGRDSGGKRGRKKNMTTHDSKGERKIYFDNDDRYDLKTLVEQEKAGTAEDQNAMFARLAGRSTDRDLDVDDMFVDKAARKQNEEKTFNKDRAAAIHEHKKISAAMEKCHRCFDKVPKHLIVAIGSKSYLCLPHHRSLADGHCFIVPMQHISAGTSMDEDVWQEMQLFRKSLVRMFAAQDQDVVVMETVMHIKHFPHTALECVPLDKEVGDLLPIYFKKAIQEAGPEWSDNKKLVELSGKDVRRAIPKGFPYFAVDFGLEGGFATVIEDEATFPSYFGREVVGGMVDAEPALWRKPHKENFESQRNKVLQFEQMWRPYDWTQDM